MNDNIGSTDRAIVELEAMSERYRRAIAGTYREQIVDPIAALLKRAAGLDEETTADTEAAEILAAAYLDLPNVLEDANLRKVGDNLGAAMLQGRLISTLAILGPIEGEELTEEFVSGP